jgi:hypothetical protein
MLNRVEGPLQRQNGPSLGKAMLVGMPFLGTIDHKAGFAGFFIFALRCDQNGTATRSWPCVPTIRACVNSPTASRLLSFSGGSNFTVPSISGASA